jgi:hypothetical protein
MVKFGSEYWNIGMLEYWAEYQNAGLITLFQYSIIPVIYYLKAG